MEKKLNDQECYISSIDQCSRRNNIEIQGIPKTVKDEELENKVIDIFSALNINITSKDVEDCHRLGKDGKNIIVRLVNRKHCYQALNRKMDLRKIDNSSLAFHPDVKLYLSENLTPCNHYLGWKCRELKRASLIHSSWSSRGVIKLRQTMNERPIKITDEATLLELYPDLALGQRKCDCLKVLLTLTRKFFLNVCFRKLCIQILNYNVTPKLLNLLIWF